MGSRLINNSLSIPITFMFLKPDVKSGLANLAADDHGPSVGCSYPVFRRPRAVGKAQLSWLPTTMDRP